MKHVGTELREIASLTTAAGFKARHDNDHTLRLIRRLQRGADVATPVVTVDGKVAWGEATIAAVHAIERKHTRCVVVECSKEELDALRKLDRAVHERKKGRTATLTVELVKSTERDVLKQWEQHGSPITHLKGVPKSRPTARAIVAAVLGQKEITLLNYESLVARGEAKTRAEPEPEWDLACHEWPAAPGLLDETRAIRQALRSVDLRLRQDQRELAPFVAIGACLPGADRVHAGLHRIAAFVRSMLPAHLCPYCKSTVDVRPTCLGCKSAGWVTEEVWARAPKELREEYLVSHGGQLLDPLTMQPPYVQRVPPRARAQFVGDSYEEEEEPPDYGEAG